MLTDGARLLRSLHDASIGFALEDSHWQSSTTVPSEVICHNDFAGSHGTWNSVVQLTIIHLFELADFSEAKAAELAKPRLNEEANDDRRDAAFLRVYAADL